MREYRIHRELVIEELELRVAPAVIGTVLNAQNPVYRFTDADGDFILLKFSGPGQAVVLGGVDGTNIAGIDFSGTTGKTNFLMKDLNAAGDNTLTAGGDSVQTAKGESLGSFQVIVPKGRFEDTYFNIDGNLGRFQVNGDTEDVDLNVWGDLTTAKLLGDALNSQVDVGGVLGMARVNGDAVECWIGGEGGVGQVIVNGSLVDSIIFTGQNASFVRVGGDMLGSLVVGMGSIDRVLVGGSVAGDGAVGAFGEPPEIDHGITVGVDLGSCIIKGDLFDAQIAAGENIGSVLIGGELLGGTIIAGGGAAVKNVKGAFFVDTSLGAPSTTGNLGRLTVQGSVFVSQVLVDGDVGLMQFQSFVAFSQIVVGGNVGQYQVSGPQFITATQIGGGAGNVLFRDVLLGSFFGVQGNVDRMTINGTIFGGEGIYIGGNLGRGVLNGDLDEDGLKVALDESRMVVEGNVSNLMINGALDNGSYLGVGNHTDSLRIIGGILDESQVELRGAVGTMQVIGAIEGVEGPTVHIGGRLIGSMLLRGNVEGDVTIDGGSRYTPITIIGDLSGELTGAAFGNVSILGNFTGLIGAEDVGVGNTLLVKGPEASGIVAPYPEAFNRYIGYDGPPPP